MKFIIKFTSSVLIIFTIYVVCVFVFPSKTDNIAKNIGIMGFNDFLRSFKTGSDTIADDLLQKTTMEQINKARNVVKQTQEQINNKVEQANRVYENGKKVLDTTEELKNSLEELTTMSSSGDTSGSGTENIQSGTSNSSDSIITKDKTNNSKLKSNPSISN